MRIFQLLPFFFIGDAIGNYVIILDKILRQNGYATDIFYNHASKEASMISNHYFFMPELNQDDIVLYHMSTSSHLTYLFSEFKCRKILFFHNITPPDYFLNYDPFAYKNCLEGTKEIFYLVDKITYCLTDSLFNKKCLLNMGYNCKIDVLPIIILFDNYNKNPSYDIVNKYSNSTINIISVGRINAPNKRLENVIKSFYFFQKYIDSNSKLFLVGYYNEENRYYKHLIEYINALNLDNIIFTGYIPFHEILAYYKIASFYLCMSEHEGFCVPLIEAMLFNKPIVAYSAAAVPETLGGSGFLIENNDPLEVALIIEKILYDPILKNDIIANQNERLSFFETEHLSNLFIQYLKNFLVI